ncbi:hypothetical protein LJK88_38990 [Paenibacillus sp. P26]|nr:hypothetical protein LJK88_38990 [Paenibacillus sp. P26]
MAVRAANVGTDPADVLLEVHFAAQAGDGLAVQQMYVQRLVAVPPNQVMTFDDIFADLDAVTVNVTTSGVGADFIAVSVAARDAQRRVIPGLHQLYRRDLGRLKRFRLNKLPR